MTTPVSAPVGGGAVVSPDEGGQFRTIGEAMREARPGTKILVRPGVYAESLVLDRRVEIVGDGSAADIVVESPDGNCLRMQTDMARVRGLTLLGAARRGGRDRYAVHVPQGRLILEDCRISSDSLACVAASNAGTAPVLRRCSIRNGRSAGVLVYDRAELRAGRVRDRREHAGRRRGSPGRPGTLAAAGWRADGPPAFWSTKRARPFWRTASCPATHWPASKAGAAVIRCCGAA